MPQSLRHQILLAALAGLLFFFNLGAAHLWDIDEAIFAQAAKEMFDRGDAVVPYFNGQLFVHKPAMMYWFMILGFKAFGAGELAVRFFSAVFGIGSVLLTYRLGRLLFSPAIGLWAGVILASNMNFNVIARAATPDAYLVFFCSLAIYLFVASTAKAQVLSGQANEANAPWAGQTRFEPSWLSYALIYGAMGLAVLTKGPIGVVLPTAVIGLFLLVIRAPQPSPASQPAALPTWRDVLVDYFRWCLRVFSIPHILRTIWSMRPLTALAMVLAVAGPWYTWVGLRTDGVWPLEFFGVHNFGRFLNAMDNHRGPIVYYVVAVAVGFFPWSVLFAPSWLDMRRTRAVGDRSRASYTLLGAWAAVWIGFFSLAGTKLPSYVVPAYPAIALFMGSFVEHWLHQPGALSRLWSRMVWGTMALAGVGVLIALPIAARMFLEEDWLLGAVGLIPLVAAVVGWTLSERGQVRGAVATLTVSAAAMALAVFGWGAPRVDRFQESPYFAQAIAARTDGSQPPTIGSYHYFRPSYVFYTGQPIAELQSFDEVAAFFAAHPDNAMLFTTKQQLAELASFLPQGVDVIASHPRFLQRGEVVLLGHSSASMANSKPAEVSPAAPLR